MFFTHAIASFFFLSKNLMWLYSVDFFSSPCSTWMVWCPLSSKWQPLSWCCYYAYPVECQAASKKHENQYLVMELGQKQWWSHWVSNFLHYLGIWPAIPRPQGTHTLKLKKKTNPQLISVINIPKSQRKSKITVRYCNLLHGLVNRPGSSWERVMVSAFIKGEFLFQWQDILF